MWWGFYVQEQTQSLWSIENFQLTFHFFSFISHSMWIKCKSFLCYLCLFEGMKPFKRLVTFNITRISTKLRYTDVMFEPEAQDILQMLFRVSKSIKVLFLQCPKFFFFFLSFSFLFELLMTIKKDFNNTQYEYGPFFSFLRELNRKS